MSSFFQKLDKNGVETQQEQESQEQDNQIPTKAAQLEVDIFQSEELIVIYAPMAGASIENLDVSVEGDNDTITIRGERKRPEHILETLSSEGIEEGDFAREECVWGKFYRQIVLPEEINIEQTQAKMYDGVLCLIIPLRESQKNKKRIQVQRATDSYENGADEQVEQQEEKKSASSSKKKAAQSTKASTENTEESDDDTEEPVETESADEMSAKRRQKYVTSIDDWKE
jgi:HSP20 family molecular chaperone IbpA